MTSDDVVLKSALHGIHVALATPIDTQGELDRAGLDRLLARVIDGGVTGVCPTGSTGEGPRLTRSQRLEVTRRVRAALGPERLLVPAASANSVIDAVAEIDDLAQAGAAAVLLAPPSYYPMKSAAVIDWYGAVAAATALPILLYNIPSMTKTALSALAVSELAKHPSIVGMKDSSRDFEYLESVLYATEWSEFSVLTGSDTMLVASLQLGAVGAIAASANLVPALGRNIYQATIAGDLNLAWRLQRQLYSVVMACRVGPTPAGWKAALALAGVCAADLVPPAPGLNKSEEQVLGSALDELGADWSPWTAVQVEVM